MKNLDRYFKSDFHTGSKEVSPFSFKIPIVITMKIFFLTFFFASFVFAGTPSEVVSTTTDNVLNVLKNQDMNKAEKTKKLTRIAEETFNFYEMAKRTLAVHWRKRTDQEKKEFVNVFKEYLKETYADKAEKYNNQSAVILDESIDGRYAIVKTKVINQLNKDISVNYKLKNHQSAWKVYDIIVDGISLVSNYRTQFNTIITSSSYDELVKQLNKKISGTS